MENKTLKKQNNKFIRITFILVIGTVVFAYYISDLLFFGNNSYEVYHKLKYKKIKLKQDIKSMQFENATLQKKYFELKNLEPDEL